MLLRFEGSVSLTSVLCVLSYLLSLWVSWFKGASLTILSRSTSIMQSKHLPPCALSECKRHTCQTFVLKLKQTQDVLTWLCEALVREPLVVEGCYPSASAVVQLCISSSLEGGLYIVLTTSQPRDFDSFACKLKSALASKALLSHIEWVKPECSAPASLWLGRCQLLHVPSRLQ